MEVGKRSRGGETQILHGMEPKSTTHGKESLVTQVERKMQNSVRLLKELFAFRSHQKSGETNENNVKQSDDLPVGGRVVQTFNAETMQLFRILMFLICICNICSVWESFTKRSTNILLKTYTVVELTGGICIMTNQHSYLRYGRLFKTISFILHGSICFASTNDPVFVLRLAVEMSNLIFFDSQSKWAQKLSSTSLDVLLILGRIFLVASTLLYVAAILAINNDPHRLMGTDLGQVLAHILPINFLVIGILVAFCPFIPPPRRYPLIFSGCLLLVLLLLYGSVRTSVVLYIAHHEPNFSLNVLAGLTFMIGRQDQTIHKFIKL